MQKNLPNILNFSSEIGEGRGFAAIVPPINLIILEKSSADTTDLKIWNKAFNGAFSEDPLKRETSAKMVNNGS